MTHQFSTHAHQRLARKGSYRPEFEGDACGAGPITKRENRRIARFLFASVLLFATVGWPFSVNASTDSTAGSETGSDEKTELARSFASLYLPTETSITGALDNYKRQFLRSLSSDPAIASLEQKYPGISIAAMAAGRAVMEKGLQEDIPKIHLELAAYMGKNFSAPEIRAINQFYGSSAGQSLLRGVSENLDADQLADDMMGKMKTGDGQMVIENDAIIGAASQAAMKSLSEEHIPAIAAFMSSPAGRKFSLHTEELLGIVTREMTVSTNRMTPEIQAEGLRALMRFTADKQ